MTVWTRSEEKEAISLWKQGETASKIADALGKTRGSVLGKLHRLQIMGDRAKTNGSISNALGRINGKLKDKRGDAPKSEPAPAHAVTWDDLEPGMCRFPFGDEAPYLFCGRRSLPGQSYCPECHGRAWRPLPVASDKVLEDA